jgi:hypothetical protein
MKIQLVISLVLSLVSLYFSLKNSDDVILHNLFTGIALVSFVSVFVILNKTQKNESIK